LQRRLMPLARFVGGRHGVAGVKAALDDAGYEGGCPRPPLRPVPASAMAELKRELDAAARETPAARS